MEQQKWKVRIRVNGKRKHLGTFVDEDDAGRAYDAAVRKADGACAYDAAVAAQKLHSPRNFPGDTGAEQAVKRAKRENISAIPDKGRSRFVGVCWDKREKKWRVRVTDKGEQKFIGYYDDETAAALAFDAYVIAKKIGRASCRERV